MKWSEIWENSKKLFESLITKDNYILIIYFSLLFLILIFAIYPFMNLIKINETMNIYKYILSGSILTLFGLFLYIFKKLDTTIGDNFYPMIVGIETFSVVIILLYITYKHLFEDFQLGQLIWSMLNIGIILGFTIYFFYSFWKCYNETTGLTCDTNLFYSWTIWSILIGVFIVLSLFFTSIGLNDWSIFAKQTMVYFMIVLFVFIILLNNNSITGGKILKKSQLVSSNSILQTLLKFFCVICILILTQVFLRYATESDPEKNGWKAVFIPIAIIILNIIPFVFNNLQTWIDKIILYPLLLLLFFGSIFFIVGGFNIFKLGYNLVVRNDKQFEVKFTSEFGWVFHAIIFIFIYGFTIFLLFVYDKYVNEAKKKHETLSDAYDNFKNWYSSNWWIWIGFVFCYLSLSGLSTFADYFFGLFGKNSNDFVQIGKNPIAIKNIELFFKIIAILLTCGYLYILYYDIFNANADWNNFLNGQTSARLYINAISIILLVCILIFTLTSYTKVNGSLIIIFILLAIIFIYNKVYDFLNVDLQEHASKNNCDNLQSNGVGFGFLFLFLSLILAFWLSGKKTNPLYLFIAFLTSMFGYYFGETIAASGNRINEDKTYCSEFKETPKLTTSDSIKIIVYISLIILLFIGMNFFTRKLTHMEGSYEIFVIGVLFYLFLTYLIIIIKSLVNVVNILYVLINKKYYTSVFPNRWCDFLLSFTTILVFMSGIGLLITTCSNKLISNFINFKDAADWFSDSTFSSLMSEISNEFISFQDNPITKTILFLLLLLYKFFQLIIVVPEKLNSIYSDIGNYIEQNFLKASINILVLEIFIICLYLLVTKTYKSINSSFVESIPLIKMPTIVFPSIPIKKKYEELPKEQPYTFGLSFSLFIEEAGSLNYFIPILSYNNNPCIMYKPSANNLIVTIPKGYANIAKPIKGDSEIINSYTILNSHIGSVVDDKYIVYSTTDVKLQKWMNIFINYNNGVIDIFSNGKLANSSNINQIISDDYSNTITFGAENVEDTHIKINNLNFYKKDIGVDNILRINLKTYTE